MYCLSIFCLILLYMYSFIIARNQEGQHSAFKFRHSIQMSLVKEFWVMESSPSYYYSVNPQVCRFLYLFTSAPQMRMVSCLPLPPLKKRKKFCAWGHSWTQFPMWQCNILTIWVTGPAPTVTSISRSIYQFNSFIFLITKLLSLWACAERLWLLIKMELY